MSRLFVDEKRVPHHGGMHAQGKRKTRRPIDRKQALHVIFRSSKAKGRLSLHRFRQAIATLLQLQSKRWGIRCYEVSINSNHIHLLIKGRDRLGIQNFLRVFPGRVAQIVMRTRKGLAGKFWDHLVFTRIVAWGRDFFGAKAYVFQNELETRGLIPYRARAPALGNP